MLEFKVRPPFKDYIAETDTDMYSYYIRHCEQCNEDSLYFFSRKYRSQEMLESSQNKEDLIDIANLSYAMYLSENEPFGTFLINGTNQKVYKESFIENPTEIHFVYIGSDWKLKVFVLDKKTKKLTTDNLKFDYPSDQLIRNYPMLCDIERLLSSLYKQENQNV